MPPLASSPTAALPRPSSSPLSNSQFEVEQILASRTVKNQLQYLVKWVGYSSDDNSWEPAANLQSASNAIALFHSSASPAPKKQDKSNKTRKAEITLQSEPNTSPLESVNSGEAIEVFTRQDKSATHIPLLLQPMDEDLDDLRAFLLPHLLSCSIVDIFSRFGMIRHCGDERERGVSSLQNTARQVQSQHRWRR
jgi:hypothetical protein